MNPGYVVYPGGHYCDTLAAAAALAREISAGKHGLAKVERCSDDRRMRLYRNGVKVEEARNA